MRGLRSRIIGAMTLTMLAIAGTAFAAQGAGKLKVQIPVAPEMYAADPQPLTVTQCGQCHPGYYREIKQDGAKHKFDCQKCHTVIHSYNPKKANFDAIMPKCASCHNEPHGAKVTNCGSCHTNPHTPKKMTISKALTDTCFQCHPGPRDQLAKFQSKHTKVACTTCHTSHGYIPNCFACHKPHNQGQEIATCAKCHPVHNPKQITYPKDSPAATCGACHKKAHGAWQKTASKHGKVNCATCHHTRHKYVPKCIECHPAPHKKEFLARFPKCLDCHLDVHDLPSGEKKK